MSLLIRENAVLNSLDEHIKNALYVANMYFKESNNYAKLALESIDYANSLINQRDVIE